MKNNMFAGLCSLIFAAGVLTLSLSVNAGKSHHGSSSHHGYKSHSGYKHYYHHRYRHHNYTYLNYYQAPVIPLTQTERYRLALYRKQPFSFQQAAIDRYLLDYPKGRFRDRIVLEKISLEKQKKDAEKLLFNLMTTNTYYQGRAGYKKEILKFKIRVDKFDKPSGKFSGHIIWKQRKGAINTVTGKLNQDNLSIQFTEIKSIKSGTRKSGSKYKLYMTSNQTLLGIHIYRGVLFSKRRGASIKIQ